MALESALKIQCRDLNRKSDFLLVSGCHEPFGIENGIVSDIKASSIYRQRFDNNYAPTNAKLNNLLTWCAVDSNPSPQSTTWLQVNLGQPLLVSGVATQGDPRYSLNYWKKFKLQFSFDESPTSFKTVKQDTLSTFKVGILFRCITMVSPITAGKTHT